MENFFDRLGRDRIIYDWMKTNNPDFLPLYENALAQFDKYRNFNTLFIIAFEAGCAFAKAAKQDRNAKVDYKYTTRYSG